MDKKASAPAVSVSSGTTRTSNPPPRQWESFPQPCGWSLRWENEGLRYAEHRIIYRVAPVVSKP